jgi:hypothetical protein
VIVQDMLGVQHVLDNHCDIRIPWRDRRRRCFEDGVGIEENRADSHDKPD